MWLRLVDLVVGVSRGLPQDPLGQQGGGVMVGIYGDGEGVFFF